MYDDINRNPSNLNDNALGHTFTPQEIKTHIIKDIRHLATYTGSISGYVEYRKQKIPFIIYKSRFYLLPYPPLPQLFAITPFNIDELLFIPASYDYIRIPQQTTNRLISSLKLPAPNSKPSTYNDLYKDLYKPDVFYLMKLCKIFDEVTPPLDTYTLKITLHH